MRRISTITLLLITLAPTAFAQEAAPVIEPLPTQTPAAEQTEVAPPPEDALSTGIPCEVTAYYSPLPDQERYFRGSYEADKKLNGNGTNGASGKQVFVGMIAAPKEYPFGTKVYIPGFGLGDVQDRGGAINNNRFDLWFGKGDLGMSRALAWGRRHVTCRVYLPGSEIPDFAKKQASILQTPAANEVTAKPAQKGTHTRDLTIGDTGSAVKTLEADLKTLGYFVVTPNETFDLATAQAVYAFQKSEDIVRSDQSYGAGFFGYQTRRALNRARTAKPTPAKAIEHPSLENLQRVLEKGASGDDVKTAQTLLAKAGYYPADQQTGIFGEMTRAAILQFQLDHGIVASATDKGAGTLGPITAKKMQEIAHTYAPGERGGVVRLAQDRLIALGKLPADANTGYLGAQTKVALAAFQVERGLVSSTKDPNAGKLGPKTLAALEEVRRGNLVQTVALKSGDRGPAVKEIQLALARLGHFSGPASGYYGAQTEAAVRVAQKKLGIIAADTDLGAGHVGPVTKRAVLAAASERIGFADAVVAE